MTMSNLNRSVHLKGAIVIGLGSILGTGVFVSLGIAAHIAGQWIILAIFLAGLIAAFNGLSSAALASAHPVSGGAYEYGYTYLTPSLGFTAGWMFLIAKSASAATAALGLSSYIRGLLGFIGVPVEIWPVRIVAFVLVLGITFIAAAGIQRSAPANTFIVSITLLALTYFIITGIAHAISLKPNIAASLQPLDIADLLQSTALIFVAFTGYGRIATLGGEVVNPKRTIPIAVVATLGLTLLLYVGVALTGYVLLPSDSIVAQVNDAAPLAARARSFTGGIGLAVLSLGAVSALSGVLLNLLFGLSRVLFAMARRADMPGVFAHVREKGSTPRNAVWAVGLLIAVLTLIGDIRITWSFSAFSVLVYYMITNMAALRIPAAEAIVPRWISWSGLFSCLLVVFFIDPWIWSVGIGIIGLGLIWHKVAIRSGYRKS